MAGRWQIFVAALVFTTVAGAQNKVYRWVDDDGVVHFGDSVPPEYAVHDRQVLNEHGVAVEHQEGTLTAGEKAARDAKLAAAEAQERELLERRARDESLLDTYISVEEIESLRDRRAEMLDARIQTTSLYLESLREKLGRLQADAARFQPYSPDPEAPPIHDNLARELSDTLDSIIRYEKTLDDTRKSRVQLMAKFDADIDRFKELKGMP